MNQLTEALTNLLSKADEISEDSDTYHVTFQYLANNASFTLSFKTPTDEAVHEDVVSVYSFQKAKEWLEEKFRQTSVVRQGVLMPNAALDTKPKLGTKYIVPDPLAYTFRTVRVWENSADDNRLFAQGLCYPQTILGETVACKRGRLAMEHLLY